MKIFALFIISAMASLTASWLYLIELPRLESENKILRSTLAERGIGLPTGIRPPAAPAQSDATGGTAASVADLPLPHSALAETPPSQNKAAPRTAAATKQADARMLAEDRRAKALEDIHRKYMILDQNESTAKSKLKELNTKKMELDDSFKEYNIVDTFDDCGEVSGSQNRGNRTSDADRRKTLAPVNEQIEHYKSLLNAIEPARNQLRQATFEAEAAYRQEMSELKAN